MNAVFDHPLQAFVCSIKIGGTGCKKIEGTGWFLDSQHVVTCQHVIDKSYETSEICDKSIMISSPFLSLTDLPVEINIQDEKRDIAILKLTGDPIEIYPYDICTDVSLSGRYWETFGFPSLLDNGVPAGLGKVGNKTGEHWFTMTRINEKGHFIGPGFSGAPVWDAVRQEVIGMVNADTKNPVIETAYMIPMEKILGVIDKEGGLSDATSEFDEKKADLFVTSVNRTNLREETGRYFVELLEALTDPVERHWLYRASGRIGGENCRRIISKALEREKFAYARIGAEKAANDLI